MKDRKFWLPRQWWIWAKSRSGTWLGIDGIRWASGRRQSRMKESQKVPNFSGRVKTHQAELWWWWWWRVELIVYHSSPASFLMHGHSRSSLYLLQEWQGPDRHERHTGAGKHLGSWVWLGGDWIPACPKLYEEVRHLCGSVCLLAWQNGFFSIHIQGY